MSNQNDQTKHERFGYDEDRDMTYDYFISHNWSVPRWKKFMALCMIWSGKRVLVSCCLVQVVCFVLVCAGALPLTPMISGEGQMSIWCSSASFLTFFVVFLFSSDVLQILGLKGYRTFLDKVCVDQSDEDKKRQGIGAITAFLYHSDAMVVLYSEMYLTRLWTVYELTTFLALKPDAQILVQPVILGPLAVYFVLIQFLRIPELLLLPADLEQLNPSDTPDMPWGLVFGLFITVDLLGVCIGAIFLRMWGSTRASMQQQIDQFSFESAACHDENDRVQILSAIKKIARQEGLVRDDAATKACIKSYEIIVRSILPRRMKHAFQLTGIPCQVAFLIALPCLSAVLDHSAVHLRMSLHDDNGGAVLETVAELLKITAKELCVPIAVGLVGIFSGIRRGSVCFEVLCTFACFVLLALGLWLPQSPMMPDIETVMPSTDVRCVVLGLTLLLQCVVILGIYGRSCCK